jgi:MoaA/NifB/PqqE/SkfB family radical SAM enzyme
MPRVNTDDQGRLVLPEGFFGQRSISPNTEYWLDEREGDVILHPCLPNARKLYIEPTTGCNLNCRTCIRNAWEDPEAQMSMDTFQQLLESLKDLPSLTRAVFTGFGEPLSHPHIWEMIQAVRARDLAVTVGSNGLLLDARMARELIQLGVDRFVVSVDGVKPETYAGARGSLLSQLLGNIRALNEAKSKMGSLTPALGVEFVVLRSNVAELAELTGLASRLGASRVLVANVLPHTEEMCSEVL